jgi:hypothetical protein
MNKRLSGVILFSIVLLISACDPDPETHVAQANPFIGIWEYHNDTFIVSFVFEGNTFSYNYSDFQLLPIINEKWGKGASSKTTAMAMPGASSRRPVLQKKGKTFLWAGMKYNISRH